MAKVCLNLTGVKPGLDAVQAAESLGSLYNKPTAHFDPLCQHLFVLQKPYELLKSTTADTAQQHQTKLEALGFQCEIKQLKNSSELSLVPLEAAAENSIKCPACEQITTDPDLCSECGVIFAKFLKQQKIENLLDTKLASAERGHQRVLKAQAAEEEQANKKNKKRKKTTTETTEEPGLDPEEEIFQARYEDTERNKVFYYAIAGTLVAAIGAGYLAHTFMKPNSINDLTQALAITSEDPTSESGDTTGSSATDQQILALVPTAFSQWNKRLFEISHIKNQLDSLNAKTGMTSTMQGLVANIEDPLIMAVGKQHLALLRINATNASTEPNTKTLTEYEKILDNNPALIQGLPSNVEKLKATISLSKILTQLGRNKEALSVAEGASAIADLVSQSDSPIDKVIAGTVMAEYTEHLGATESSTAHFDAAITSAKSINNKTAEHQASIPFIVRSKARIGQFADAHALLEEIPDQNIRTLVMEDIRKYAASPATEEPALSNGLTSSTGQTNEQAFSDDADIMLLLENDKKLKQQAKKLSKITSALR